VSNLRSPALFVNRVRLNPFYVEQQFHGLPIRGPKLMLELACRTRHNGGV
jgi:hypothetical protein